LEKTENQEEKEICREKSDIEENEENEEKGEVER